MDTEAIAGIPLCELIGQMIRSRKAKTGTTTPEFEAYVVEKELPEIVSRISRLITVKRLHKLEGQFLGLGGKKTARKGAVRGDDRGVGTAGSTTTGGQ